MKKFGQIFLLQFIWGRFGDRGGFSVFRTCVEKLCLSSFQVAVNLYVLFMGPIFLRMSHSCRKRTMMLHVAALLLSASMVLGVDEIFPGQKLCAMTESLPEEVRATHKYVAKHHNQFSRELSASASNTTRMLAAHLATTLRTSRYSPRSQVASAGYFQGCSSHMLTSCRRGPLLPPQG